MAKLQLVVFAACLCAAYGAPQTMIVTQDSRNALDGLNTNKGLNAVHDQNGGPVMIVRQSSHNKNANDNELQSANLLSHKTENAGAGVAPPPAASCNPNLAGLPGFRCRQSLVGGQGYGNVQAYKASYVIPQQVVGSVSCGAPSCVQAQPTGPSVTFTEAKPLPCTTGACVPDSIHAAGAAGYSAHYRHSSSSSSHSDSQYDVSRYGAATLNARRA